MMKEMYTKSSLNKGKYSFWRVCSFSICAIAAVKSHHPAPQVSSTPAAGGEAKKQSEQSKGKRSRGEEGDRSIQAQSKKNPTVRMVTGMGTEREGGCAHVSYGDGMIEVQRGGANDTTQQTTHSMRGKTAYVAQQKNRCRGVLEAPQKADTRRSEKQGSEGGGGGGGGGDRV